MKVHVYYDDSLEYFDVEGNILPAPIGSAFMDIINADFFKRPVLTNPLLKENPLLAPFKIAVGNITELQLEEIVDYEIATDNILNLNNKYYNNFDIYTRFLIHQKYLNKKFANEFIPSGYICWNKGDQLPDSKDILKPTSEKEVHENIAIAVKNINPSPRFMEVYEIDSFEKGLFISFMKMVMKKVIVKRCKCCEKFFIPQGRIDTEYCDRIAPNSTKTCREIGAIKKYHNKSKDNPIMKEFQKEYKKMSGRVRIKKISQSDFFNWSEKARELRDNAIEESKNSEDMESTLEKFRSQLKKMEV